MMKFSVRNIILFFLFFSIHAVSLTSFALLRGNDRGNGGAGVYCANSGTLEVLDHYLARVMYDEPSSYAKGTWKEYLEIIFRRLERVNPSRAQQYREWLAHFSEEAQFTQTPLKDTQDWGIYPLPAADCELKQLAAQPDYKIPGKPVYTFVLPLWNQLDEENKAILVLHEMVYREILETIQYERVMTDADTIRMYVSLLAGQRFSNISLQVYYDFVNQYTYFRTMDSHDGQLILLFEYVKADDGYVYIERNPVKFHNGKIMSSAKAASGCDLEWDSAGHLIACR